MRLLIGFLAVCILAVVLVTWRIAASGVGPARGDQPRPSLATASRPAESRPVEPAAGAGRAPSVAAGGHRVEPSEAPATQAVVGVPARAPSPVHWAAGVGRRETLRRLAAARAVLAQDPCHPTALRDELAALRELGRWSEAADTLEKLVELEPSNAARRFEYAETLVRLERWASALAPLCAYVDEVPDHPAAWRYLAAAQQTLGHLQDAQRSWSRVLALLPEDAAAYAHRGEVRLDLHEWAGAAADLEQAARRDPSEVGVVLNLARALSQLGDEQQARQWVLDVLEQHPRDVRAMNLMAELAWRTYRSDPVGGAEQLETTVAWCRRSLAIDSNQPATRALLEAALDAGDE